MRRTPLDPPRPLLTEALVSIEPPSRVSATIAPSASGTQVEAPARDVLSGVAPAEERRRALFHPRRGWFRRLERRTSHWLAREVYPRVPALHLPYDRQLRHRLTLSEADIALDGLPASFDGLRILFLSDLHAGPFVSPRVLQATVERLLGVEPDLVLLGGDLTTASVSEFETHRAAFASMRAPLGVYGVLGNHDHYSGEPERLRELIEDAGIGVLHNRAVVLERGGQSLDLAGVDDLLMGRPDLAAALDGARSPVVLLSHNPDLFFEAARRGVALTLAGHTHGGQIRIPGLPVLVRQSRYRLDQGRYRSGRSELVVSRGLGAVGVPLRAACRPEGVLIRLRRSPA
jgi:predicted MPP superfamily phosphohydrolase